MIQREDRDRERMDMDSSTKTPIESNTVRPKRYGSRLFLSVFMILLMAGTMQIVFHSAPALEHQQRYKNQMIDPTIWKLQVKKNNSTSSNVIRNPTTKQFDSSQNVETEPPEQNEALDLQILVQDTVRRNPLIELLEEAKLIRPEDVKQHLDTLNNPNETTVVIDGLTLPTWPLLQSLYGKMEQPIVLGMERCQTYRDNVSHDQRYTAVAGMFNTGTNAMQHHLKHNLVNMRSTWQVPWGKHRMPFVRLSHKANGLEKEDQTKVMPIVMIRDPFHWMQSMCKMPYATHWKHTKKHCPNLIPNEFDIQRFGSSEPTFRNGTAAIKVIFSDVQIFHWESLVDLYSDYYRQYLEADYPRLIVRFEDMLLQPRRVLAKVAECVGTTVAEEWKYQTESSKGHGSHTTFAAAITKTGDAQRRVAGMTVEDLSYAATHLDPEVIQRFQYNIPESIT